MTKMFIIGAVIVVLGGVGWAIASQMSAGDSMMKDDAMKENKNDAMMQDDPAMMKEDTMASTSDAMMQDDTMMEEKGDAMMTQ